MDLRMWTYGPAEKDVELTQSALCTESTIENSVPVLGIMWDRIEDNLYIEIKTGESFPETGDSINGLLTVRDQSGLRRHSHAGVQALTVIIREEFWIIGARRRIRSVVKQKQCVRCKRFSAKPPTTAPIQLPLDRVRDAFAFEVTGIDLCGPLILKNKNKDWVVLFTCAVYRCVHLELMTSETLHPITWKFIPPTAAWWGGWWERLIRTTKNLIVRVLGQAAVNYEELLTVICDVEAVINCRPLTYVSNDSEDLLPLTPSMFLQDIKVSGTADLDTLDRNKLLARQRFCQELREQFRSRFCKELPWTVSTKAWTGL
ncbi:uncharacterized protein LOC118193377 [Stegodyphus dumicola]|uniref:uncharacterized protein LOC118193377 n=1 Tax=Stegodyphus dumicola TaxID=202533 RepID=UPI0015A8C7E0|nr:uncharacterized protein LOC118193377 [Stegodyphus dumicola]